MSELNELITRRKLLLAQSALQRATLTQEIASWQPRLTWVDRGIAAGRYLQRHPTALAALGLLVAALRPHRAAILLERGWMLWQISRSLRNSWSK